MHLFTTDYLDAAEDNKVCELSKRKQLLQGNIFKMCVPVQFGGPSKTHLLRVWLTD